MPSSESEVGTPNISTKRRRSGDAALKAKRLSMSATIATLGRAPPHSGEGNPAMYIHETSNTYEVLLILPCPGLSNPSNVTVSPAHYDPEGRHWRVECDYAGYESGIVFFIIDLRSTIDQYNQWQSVNGKGIGVYHIKFAAHIVLQSLASVQPTLTCGVHTVEATFVFQKFYNSIQRMSNFSLTPVSLACIYRGIRWIQARAACGLFIL